MKQKEILKGSIIKFSNTLKLTDRFILEVHANGEKFYLINPANWNEVIQKNLNIFEKFKYRLYPVKGHLQRLKEGASIIFEYKVIYDRNYIVKIIEVF